MGRFVYGKNQCHATASLQQLSKHSITNTATTTMVETNALVTNVGIAITCKYNKADHAINITANFRIIKFNTPNSLVVYLLMNKF